VRAERVTQDVHAIGHVRLTGRQLDAILDNLPGDWAWPVVIRVRCSCCSTASFRKRRTTVRMDSETRSRKSQLALQTFATTNAGDDWR
jgi:hypothetical protein